MRVAGPPRRRAAGAGARPPVRRSRPFRPVDLRGSHRVSLPDGRIRGTPVIDATLRRAPRWTGVRTPGARPALRRPAAARRRRSARGAGRGVPAARPRRLRSRVRGVARRGRAGAGVVRQRAAAGRGRAAARVRRDRHAAGTRRIGAAAMRPDDPYVELAAPGRGPFRARRVGVHRSVPARRGRAARRPVRRHPLAPRAGSRRRLPGRRRPGRPDLPAAGPDLDLGRGHRRASTSRSRSSRPTTAWTSPSASPASSWCSCAGRAGRASSPAPVWSPPARQPVDRAPRRTSSTPTPPPTCGCRCWRRGCGMSERHFSREFARALGCPPGRLRRAGAGRRRPPAAGVRAGPRRRGRRAVRVRLGRDHATGLPPPRSAWLPTSTGGASPLVRRPDPTDGGRTMQVAIPLFPRLTALDAIGPYEVLQRVPDVDVVFVGERRGEVRTENGFLGPHRRRHVRRGAGARTWSSSPAGSAPGRCSTAARSLDWVRTVHPGTRFTTSVCTGSLVLAAAGLLDGLDRHHALGRARAAGGLGAEPVSRAGGRAPGPAPDHRGRGVVGHRHGDPAGRAARRRRRGPGRPGDHRVRPAAAVRRRAPEPGRAPR